MAIEYDDIVWPDTLMLFRTYANAPLSCACSEPVQWMVHLRIPSVPLVSVALHNVCLPCGHLMGHPRTVQLPPLAVAYALLAGEPNEP